MRKLLVAIALAALAGTLSASALAATRTVKVGDFFFVRDGSPPTITVERGTKVRFRWVGSQLHNVHVRRGPRRFTSRVKDSGGFARTLRRAGTYKIICQPHSSQMKLTIHVR